MTEYWIIRDGNQEGPFSREQMLAMELEPSTPVWRTGLPDWTTAGELADLIPTPDSEPAATAGEPAQSWEPTPPPIPQPSAADAAPFGPAQPTGVPRIPFGPAAPLPGQRHTEPAPTYLGWSVAATLLCCTVLGIVAIIYAVKVRNANDRGEYDAAWRYHSTLELWLITAITLGIITAPFSMLFQMAAQ